MNRKRLMVSLIMGLLLVLAVTVTAYAATDPIKVTMELSQKEFSEPTTITVSITVSNIGDGEMPSPVTLYYPDDTQVEEFGSPTLSVGGARNWSGPWKVTQEELEAGKITFGVRYQVTDDEGNLLNKVKHFSLTITYIGADPEVEVTRKIIPTTAKKGQEVTVTYEVTNKSAVDVSAVTIKENSAVSQKSATIDNLPVGATVKHTFTAVMGSKDITSAATVTYKANGKTYTTDVPAETIHYGEVKLSAALSADKKGGAPGDTVKLTLKLTNSGTVDFTNVTVTDAALGTVFSGQTVPAKQTVTLEKDLTVTETQDLQFVVTADDPTGAGVETATGQIQVIAADPTRQVSLRVEASADRDTVYRIPGIVRFTVTVHNDSAVDVNNISVRAVDVTLYTFETIKAGSSASFTRDTEISMAGNFQFTANCRDQLSQPLSFASNIIPIVFAAPTPEPTQAPLVTPPAPATEPIPQDLREPEWLDQVEGVADSAKWILAGITGVLVLLLGIGLIRRMQMKAHSSKAMDHLDGANYRDYSVTPRRGKRNEISNGEQPAAPAGMEAQKPEEAVSQEAGGKSEREDTVQDGELMAETLRRLYSEPEKPEEAPEAPMAEESAEAETAAEQPAPIEAAPAAEEEAPVKAEAEDAAETPARRRSRKKS